jgi:hypothetical protein
MDEILEYELRQARIMKSDQQIQVTHHLSQKGEMVGREIKKIAEENSKIEAVFNNALNPSYDL